MFLITQKEKDMTLAELVYINLVVIVTAVVLDLIIGIIVELKG